MTHKIADGHIYTKQYFFNICHQDLHDEYMSNTFEPILDALKNYFKHKTKSMCLISAFPCRDEGLRTGGQHSNECMHWHEYILDEKYNKGYQSTTCAQKHSLLLATLCRHLNASWSYSRRMHLPMRKVEPVWLTRWVWTDTRRALSSDCTTSSAFGRCVGRPVSQRVFMRHSSPPSSSWGWCRGTFGTEEVLNWSIFFTNVSVTETLPPF